MSWSFSGGEWKLDLTVIYGEESITKSIYLKEGGENGESEWCGEGMRRWIVSFGQGSV